MFGIYMYGQGLFYYYFYFNERVVVFFFFLVKNLMEIFVFNFCFKKFIAQ